MSDFKARCAQELERVRAGQKQATGFTASCARRAGVPMSDLGVSAETKAAWQSFKKAGKAFGQRVKAGVKAFRAGYRSAQVKGLGDGVAQDSPCKVQLRAEIAAARAAGDRSAQGRALAQYQRLVRSGQCGVPPRR